MTDATEPDNTPLEVGDFSSDPKMTVQYFKSLEADNSADQINENTVSQIAAYDTLLQEVPSQEGFRTVREQLSTEHGRAAFMEARQEKENLRAAQIRKDVGALISDPNTPIEVKEQSVKALGVEPRDVTKNERDEYSEASLIADSDLNETEEAANSRLTMIDSIRDVNKKKEFLQKAINGLAVAGEQGTFGTVVDVAELMLPYAEWVHISQLQAEVGAEGREGLLLGSQKANLFEQFENMPLDKKVELSSEIIRIMTEHEDIVFTDGNQLAKVDNLRKMLLNNDYSTTEKWFDNITSVIDAVPLIGATVKAVVKGGKAIDISKSLKAAEALFDEARATSTQSKVSPTSPAENVKDTNPEQARNMHALISEDTTEEAAKALTGASREEAIIKAELPDAEVVAGKMPNKVKMEGVQFRDPDAERTARQSDGASYLSESEVGKGRAKLIAGFEDIEGMNIHKGSMNTRTTDEGKFSITARYSPRDSGFATAARAIENAEYAFSHYGLKADDFVLYERIGKDLVETTQKDLQAKQILRQGFVKAKKKIPEELKTIDYAIGVRHETSISPQDIDIYDVLTVKRNWLDRFDWGIGKSGRGSITQHLLDAASVLHPQIVEPAAAATYRGSALKKLYVARFKGFAKTYNKAKRHRRAAMTDYINEANDKGIRFSETDLLNRGFNQSEISALREWRRANDIMYHATNADMAKTMKNRGMFGLVHPDSDTLMFVKPIKRGSVDNGEHVYDPKTNRIVELSTEELDEMYEKGGGIAKVNEPVEVDGVWVDRIMYNDTPEGGYLRAIRDDETVMTYRDGYYPVMYDANFFIQKVIKLAGGKTRTKTIASARSQLEVDRYVAGLQKSEPDTEFRVVPDRRRGDQRSDQFDENSWNLAQSSGLSSQKLRGERLVDAGVDLEKAGRTNLVDPLEAISAQIESISSRVSMRNYMDTTKQRWISNYADKLDIPKNKFGEVEFPANVSDIKGKSGTSRKLVADARTLYNHLYSLENGFINTIDEAYRALMHWGADELSNMGFGKADELLRSTTKGRGPTSLLKGTAMKLFLAANPLRQVVIQSHQTVQLTAIAPDYVTTGLGKDLWRLSQAALGLNSKDKEALEMLRELRRTGLLDSVDENNLVRGGMLQLAEATASQKVGAVSRAPFNFLRRAGFDKGEQTVLITSWLTHRHMAIKQGKKLDRRGLDEVVGKASAFAYNMNRAGDMPYNQNTLSLMAQFIQVPHKAMLQMFTNRSLTRTQRAKLITFNTLMYGVPTDAMGWLYNNMEEGKLRDTLEYGLEDVLLNNLFTSMTGEEQQVDWGDLAPTNAYGLRDFTVGLLTTDLSTLLTESPSGSLFFGDNARLTNAFKTALRWSNVIDDYDDPELQTRFTDVGLAFAETMSGASNAFKSAYAFKNKQKRSSIGSITDSETTRFEAGMQLFGFHTKTESGVREVNEKIFGKGSFQKSDVRIYWTELKRHLTRRGDTPLEQDMRERVISEAMRVFKDDPFKFRDELLSLIQKDAYAGDTIVVDNIRRQAGIKSNEEVRSLINTLPKSDIRDKTNLWIDNLERASNK